MNTDYTEMRKKLTAQPAWAFIASVAGSVSMMLAVFCAVAALAWAIAGVTQ